MDLSGADNRLPFISMKANKRLLHSNRDHSTASCILSFFLSFTFVGDCLHNQQLCYVIGRRINPVGKKAANGKLFNVHHAITNFPCGPSEEGSPLTST